MRISSSMLFTGGSAQIDNLQAQLVHQQQEISSGTSILTPADNPVNAAQALVVTQSQNDNTQFGTNRQYATNSLSQEETTLQGVTTLVQNVQSAIVDAGNASYTTQQRQAIATSLQQTYNQLLALANSQDGNGNYLFSGYQSGVQPFTAINGGAQYNGSQGQTTVQVSVSSQMQIGDSGDTVFENNTTGNGTFVTAATAGNLGSGTISGGAVVNAAQLTGDSYSITFNGSQTAAGAGNTGSGSISSATAALGGVQPTGDLFTLNFTSPNTYDVVNNTTGASVSTNNTFLAGQPITVGGSQFTIEGNPAVNDTFTLQDNPTTYTVVDNTNPASVTIPPPNQPYVSGQAIQFDGLSFNVTGNPAGGSGGASPGNGLAVVPADSFTINPSPRKSIFTTLTNLINLLNQAPPGTGAGVAYETNLTNGLNTANNDLGNALNNVLTVRASIGARLNELTALNTQGQGLGLEYSTTLSNLQDLDYAKAISNFSQQQMTLNAAQQSFVKISNLSLFNYL